MRGRQKRRRCITACLVSSRHEYAVGDALAEVHVAVERGAEAVQEGGAAEPRARSTWRVGGRPLSEGEAAGVSETFIDRMFGKAMPLPTVQGEPWSGLVKRIARGGYPELLRRTAAEKRRAWFGSYVTTILQRDVRDPTSTFKRYMALLEATFLVHLARRRRRATTASVATPRPASASDEGSGTTWKL